MPRGMVTWAATGGAVGRGEPRGGRGEIAGEENWITQVAEEGKRGTSGKKVDFGTLGGRGEGGKGGRGGTKKDSSVDPKTVRTQCRSSQQQ